MPSYEPATRDVRNSTSPETPLPPSPPHHRPSPSKICVINPRLLINAMPPRMPGTWIRLPRL